MTWSVHSKWIERQHDGTDAFDLDGAGANTLKLAIVTDAVIDPDTDSTYPGGLTAVGTATAWTGPITLATLTCGLSSGDLIFDADDPAQIATDAGGFTDGRSIVIYEDTNSHILCHHTEGANFGNVDGPININFSADGIIKWQI